MADLRFFDPEDEYTVFERRLPHWSQAGSVCFITIRTADSMPKEVLQRWLSKRAQLLQAHKIPRDDNWKGCVQRLPRAAR